MKCSAPNDAQHHPDPKKVLRAWPIVVVRSREERFGEDSCGRETRNRNREREQDHSCEARSSRVAERIHSTHRWRQGKAHKKRGEKDSWRFTAWCLWWENDVRLPALAICLCFLPTVYSYFYCLPSPATVNGPLILSPAPSPHTKLRAGSSARPSDHAHGASGC